MILSLEIAKRYLVGKKSTTAINIITWISVVGISIGTAALILSLSVFNGFESLLISMLDTFNPDLKLAPIEGKYFSISDEELKEIEGLDGITAVSRTIEEVALFDYKDVQIAGKIKGVDEHFANITGIDTTLRSGRFVLEDKGISYGIFGRGIFSNLSINSNDAMTPVKVHMPLRKKSSLMSQLGKEFKTMNMYPGGTFSVGGDADVQYVLVSYDFANELLSLKDKSSFLELKLAEGASEKRVRQQILSVLGDNIEIKNRYEQDAHFLRVMNIERWVVFLIVFLILVVIAFNMVGSLWLMVLEKEQDIKIFKSMGYGPREVSQIFLLEGLLITAVGIVIGLVLSLVLYFLQKNYGIIGVPEGFMISAYPIELNIWDFVLVIFTVFAIGYVASLLPSYRARKV